MDARSFRNALGTFATGVAIVTARASDGSLAGVTVNSFASVSLDPPLVLWSLKKGAPSHRVFEDATHFAVHVLAADQKELSSHFATPAVDKFAGLPMAAGLGTAPILTGCSALFECRRALAYEGGDHTIFVGCVERFDHCAKEPLVFHRGKYANVVAA